MTKPRRHLDEVSVNLPEIVVMPRGSYIDWKGDEDIVPSKEQFIDDTINKRRVEAIHSMINKKSPDIPNIPSTGFISTNFGRFGMSDDTRRFIFGKDKDGSTCIYTVTTNYKDKPVSGNKTFANNPENYGFKEVDNKEGRLGDMVQFYINRDPVSKFLGFKDLPSHATMITGFNWYGEPALSYSNGTRDSDAIRVDNDNWGQGGERDLTTIGDYIKTYRYIGSPELRKKTASRYDYLYSRRSNMIPIKSNQIPVKNRQEFKHGGIYIKPSKRGTFTAAATKHGMGVQEFAARVLRNKEDYSPSLVKKANFARNASKWNH